MNRLHKLCHDPGRKLIQQNASFSSRSQICWYPSSGPDYRHISFLEEEWFYGEEPPNPLIYLHTDIRPPNSGDLREKSRNFVPFETGEQLAKGLFVNSVTEVFLKDPVKHLADQVIYDAKPNHHMGRAFFVEMRVEFEHKNMAVWVLAPLLFVIAENLAFLVRVLLHQRFHIHTLIHIRDGGASLGESRIPMNFIYQVADQLKLKRVISDRNPETRLCFTRQCTEALQHEIDEWGRECCFQRDPDSWELSAARKYRLKAERNGDGHYDRHWDRSGDEEIEKRILERWKSDSIGLHRFPANWVSPPDSYYYDWRTVPRTHAYQDGKVISP